MANTKQRTNKKRAAAIPADTADLLTTTVEPILTELEAQLRVDRILLRTDFDTPEPLAELLCFLGVYQKEPRLIDAFDLLVSAAYNRSQAHRDNRSEFIESLEANRSKEAEAN